MPAPAEKEAKKSSTWKTIKHAAITSILLVAWYRGHAIRMEEQNGKSVPDVIPSSTPSTSPTPEPLPQKGEKIVIYQHPPQNGK